MKGHAMERADLHAFLARHRYGVVSSTAADGTAQSALVGIAVSAELEIVFDTLRTTRKFANLVARPQCSFVIGWDAEQTVQLEGTAELLTGERSRQFLDVYFATWPDGAERLSWPGLVHFVVTPRWVRYSDFDRTPPLIDETTLSGFSG
jgi:pyridoxine/pyridoxamine 5'-phosphate oxidase